VLRVGSTEEEGGQVVVLTSEPRRRQRAEQGAGWREGGGGRTGKSVARRAPFIAVRGGGRRRCGSGDREW
jgi:hypothetical protein